MLSGNKACIFTVLFHKEFQRPFRNFLSTPEALWEARPQLCSFTLETEAPVCPGQVLKAAGSQQGWAWTPPGVAHPLFHVMLSQHHCHLTCRNVSLLSPTLKHTKPSPTTGRNLDLLLFPEDLHKHTYTEQVYQGLL